MAKYLYYIRRDSRDGTETIGQHRSSPLGSHVIPIGFISGRKRILPTVIEIWFDPTRRSTGLFATANRVTPEGTIAFQPPGSEKTCQTYYTIIGDFDLDTAPLIILHGGPGTGHGYLLPFGRLWESHGIPVVFYDQIGCGLSTHYREKVGDDTFWTEALFLAELNHVIDHLHLRDGPGFHVLGHSWGGRIAAAFGTTQPRGLRRLVIASGLSSTETQWEGTKLGIRALPPITRHVIEEGMGNDDYESPRMKEALGVRMRQSFVRTGEWPPKALESAFKNMAEDNTVSISLTGSDPLRCTGSLRDWTCIPRLPKIEVPTLVYYGEFDSSHEVTQLPFFKYIPRVRLIRYEGAAHMCHLEEDKIADKVYAVVADFLSQ